MNYCIDYKKDYKYFDEVSEFTIKYRKDLDIQKLSKFQGKRINIAITTANDARDFIEWKAIYLLKSIKDIDLHIKLIYGMDEIAELCKKHKIPFFYELIATQWDGLNGLAEEEVSDIYIGEDLGFEIKKVAEVLHNRGIKVRAFPNIAQSVWQGTAAYRKFFIRPEDMYLYEDYIDSCEFFNSIHNNETYYKIYAIDKKWEGNLSECIIDLDQSLDNRFLIPEFGTKRFNCEKRCAKGQSCSICNQIMKLSNTLKEKQLQVEIKDN